MGKWNLLPAGCGDRVHGRERWRSEQVLAKTREARLDLDEPVPVPVRGGRLGAADLMDLSRRGRFVAIEAFENARGMVMNRGPERELRGQKQKDRWDPSEG